MFPKHAIQIGLAAVLASACAEPAPPPTTGPPSQNLAGDGRSAHTAAEGEIDAPAERKVAAPAADTKPAPPDRGTVLIVPLRSFPEPLLAAVEERLRSEIHVEVRRHAVEPLPRSTYYKPRRRYRADKLLDHLETIAATQPASTRVLGLTEVDISTTKGEIKDWGVFGLGAMPGRSAVVSSFRLRRRAPPPKVRFRVATVALHEVGHMFGLDHCEEPRCSMQDAHGSIENTDTSTGRLGPECEAELRAKAP